MKTKVTFSDTPANPADYLSARPGSQPPAAGEAAHKPNDVPYVEISAADFKKRGPIADEIDPRLTPVPAGPFTVEETRAFSAGWETAIRGADGRRLCTIIERDHMPKESGAVRAAFIVRACNAHEKVCGLLSRAVESVRDESLKSEINETLRSL